MGTFRMLSMLFTSTLSTHGVRSRDVTSRPITVAPHIPFRILPSTFRTPQFRILPIDQINIAKNAT